MTRRGAVQHELVSPGLMPRPSLSAATNHHARSGAVVSPGLMPRPSLSAGHTSHVIHAYSLAGVAGVDAPAFVERFTPIRYPEIKDLWTQCRRG